jgi:glyoxylase-like metal-dependent hydrolase (beta-lactamase superfamily II)
MKRVLKVLGVILLLLVIAGGLIWYTAFSDNKPIADGEELVPGVRTIKDSFVSSFLVDAGGGKYLLIDAGKNKSGAPILADLRKHNIRDDQIAAIFLTHGHGDHTAAAKLFPAAKVYAMAAEVERIGDDAKVDPVADGQTVTVGETPVECYATPGHTAGSAVFFTHGVLFFGDSAKGTKEGKFARAVRLFSKDPTLNVASMKAIAAKFSPRAAEVKRLAFAHSGPLDGLTPLSDFAAAN